MNAELLLKKLPEIKAWVESTLVEYQAKGQSVASYCHRRLGGFYPADLLDSTLVVEVPRIPIPPLTEIGLIEFADFERGDYQAITYLNTFFVQEVHALSESLHFHELVHVVQWQHLGFDRFLLEYATGYLLGGSYEKNPLEVMAYGLQARFDKNPEPFDVDRLVRQQLDSLFPAALDHAFRGEL